MFPDTLLEMPPAKVLGLLGAAAYMGNYAMLTTRVLSTEGRAYFAVNLLAAGLVLVSLRHEFNAPTAVIQSFWICVSVWGLSTRLCRRRPAPPRRDPRPARLRPLG